MHLTLSHTTTQSHSHESATEMSSTKDILNLAGNSRQAQANLRLHETGERYSSIRLENSTLHAALDIIQCTRHIVQLDLSSTP